MATRGHGPFRLTLLTLLFVTIIISSSYAVPRLVVSVPEVALSAGDTSGVVTVYVNNYRDSLAGVELQLLTSDSSSISFLPQIDTAGTLMSGWELIMISAYPGRVHIAGLVNATKFTLYPPPPSSGHPLIRFHYRVNRANIPSSVTVQLVVDTALGAFGFSDPMGVSIGLVTHVVYDTVCYRCTNGTPDACNTWEIVTEPPCDSIYLEPHIVTELDTSQVIIDNGSIYIPPCCTGMRGNINGDVQNTVDLTDLSMLISHLIVRPVQFGCIFEADVNGSGTIDLTDLSMLIAFLIQGHPLLPCPQ